VAEQQAQNKEPYWVAVLAVGTVSLGAWGGHWVASLAAVFGYVLIPGSLMLGYTKWRSEHRLLEITAATALGLVFMMLVGYVSSIVGTWFGVGRLLDRGKITWVWAALMLAACVLAGRGWDRLGALRPTDGAKKGIVWRTCLVTVPPFLAAVGAEKLNRGNGNDLALAAMWTAWLVLGGAVITACRRKSEQRESGILAALYGAALTVVWGTSLRGHWLFGWDIQKEHGVAEATKQIGRWSSQNPGDAYNAMLSITTLPVQISALSGIAIEQVFRWLYPVLLAGVVPVMYRTLRYFSSVRSSAIATVLLLLAARGYPQQLPAVARQEIALFVFAVALSIMAGGGGRRNKQIISVVLLSSIGFVHYTSSYAVVAMCAAAAVLGSVVRRKNRKTGNKTGIITVPVAVCVAVVSLGWNLSIGGEPTFYDEPARSTGETGLSILERDEETSLLQRWVRGSGARFGSAEEYAAKLEESRGGELDWMLPDRKLDTGYVATLKAPVSVGPLAAWNGPWNALNLVLNQGVVLLTTAAFMWVLWWGRRRLGADLVGFILVAFALNVLLRISDTVASFYNPERGSFHSATILAVAVAPLLDRMAEKRDGNRSEETTKKPVKWRKAVSITWFAAAGAGILITYGSWGLGSHTFAGKPRAAVTNYGEDVERFVYSSAERRTALWLSENVKNGLVQSDRYGRVLLTGTPWATYDNVDIMHPAYIDERAWVFATRTNLIDGRARGYLDKIFAVYEAPVDRLERERSIVYATEHTRIYR